MVLRFTKELEPQPADRNEMLPSWVYSAQNAAITGASRLTKPRNGAIRVNAARPEPDRLVRHNLCHGSHRRWFFSSEPARFSANPEPLDTSNVRRFTAS